LTRSEDRRLRSLLVTCLERWGVQSRPFLCHVTMFDQPSEVWKGTTLFFCTRFILVQRADTHPGITIATRNPALIPDVASLYHHHHIHIRSHPGCPPTVSQKASGYTTELFRTTHKVKTQPYQVTKSRGQRCGDIEFDLTDTAGPVPLVLDLCITHERWGSRANPILNGQLHYPRPTDIDRPLNEATVVDKIRDYRGDYNKCPFNAISLAGTGWCFSGGGWAGLRRGWTGVGGL
jgi:hypothetical protein